MSPWIIAIGVGAAGALFALFFGRREAAYPYGPLPDEPAPGAALELSPPLQASVAKYKKDPTKSPQQISALGAALAARGYRLSAAEVYANARMRAEKLGGFPHTIRAGETPASVAQAWTGDPARKKELLGRPYYWSSVDWARLYPVAVVDPKGGWRGSLFEIRPWKVGHRVILPITWRPPFSIPGGDSAR